MLIIEGLVYVCIASLIIFFLNVINKAQLAKGSDFIYSGVILFLISIQIFRPISSQTLDTDPPMALICIGAILVLTLIYVLVRVVGASTDTQEYARVSTLLGMFIVFSVIFCMTLMELPETQTDLYRMSLALALCIGMAYYPPALDRLKASRSEPEQLPETETHEDAVLDTTTETDIEKHKDAVINLVAESWRLAKVFELALIQLNVDKPRRYTSRIEWFIKKAEESLERTRLRIVNLEGHPYDPGMAAAPVNLEEFDVEDSLEVSLMVEPIIMEGTVLVKRGKVSLRKVES